MKIPFFNYQGLYQTDKDKYLEIFDNVCREGAFIMQEDLSNFEKSLAEYVHSKYAIGVANGTDAMELALLTLKLKPEDEIIISTHTMLATASSIIIGGAKPVPVDIGDDYLINYESIEQAINKNTVGIMPTQLNGRTCNMDKILKIADKNGLFIIEDSAQALGSKFKNKYAGTFGISGSYSFYPAKVLGSFGDGGGIVCNDYNIYDKMFQMHDHGRNKDGEVKSWGRNSRMDNLQAAFLNYKFKNYDKIISRRRELAGIYEELLKDNEFLNLPPSPNSCSDHFDVYQNYELIAERRDELKLFLGDNGIGTLIQWGGKAIHQWEELDISSSNCIKADNFFKKCIMLPMNDMLNNNEIYYICEKINQFYGIK